MLIVRLERILCKSIIVQHAFHSIFPKHNYIIKSLICVSEYFQNTCSHIRCRYKKISNKVARKTKKLVQKTMFKIDIKIRLAVHSDKRYHKLNCLSNFVLKIFTVNKFFTIWKQCQLTLLLCFSFMQFVSFTRVYNSTPTVLVSANHSTTVSGNSAPIHNGITSWIEVTFSLIGAYCSGFLANKLQTKTRRKIKLNRDTRLR